MGRALERSTVLGTPVPAYNLGFSLGIIAQLIVLASSCGCGLLIASMQQVVGREITSVGGGFKSLFYIVFSFMNVQIYTEVMNSEGRTDAIMYLGNTIYIIEAKLDSTPQDALEQIRRKGYADRFAGSDKLVVCLGLNFSSQTRTLDSWAIA